MAEKILYILGAGASVKSLPLAKSVWGSDLDPIIEGLAYSLKKTDLRYISSEMRSKEESLIITEMQERFKKLALKADEFGDVDTYAKYLNLMHPDGEEIIELKRTLSEFFIIKQIGLNAIDSRYLPWLVSIMTKKTFPENVKILSWNYDFQMELAAAQIGVMEDVEHTDNSFVYSPSSFLSYPNLDPTFSDYNSLSLIHLNGIAGFFKSSNTKRASAFQKKYFGDMNKLAPFLKENADKTQLHFAWEQSEYHSDLMSHVKSMIEGTTILVVIGYSFPFFNREIDKQIFNSIKGTMAFEKIYYQDPILTGQQLKSQFKLSSSIEITHISNTNNFYIPFEY